MRRILAVAALFAPACDGGEARGPLTVSGEWPVAVEFPRGPEPRYERVVLVTIDTLRADHVSAYGYRRPTTPFLDRLARAGVLFTRAVSTVAHTAPSHSSMLTGLPTLVHGVEHNGYMLDDDAIDLARVFGAAGFETAACVNEEFLERIANSFQAVHSSRARGEEVLRLARRWLSEERRGERFFLWVHLFDPHRWKNLSEPPGGPPLAEPPEGFAEYLMELHGLDRMGVEGLLAQRIEMKDGKSLKLQNLEQYLRFIDSYDRLIRYADAQIEQLHRAVEALGLPGRTLWIVTADHGEGLASHGHDAHIWNIYQEQLHVPLLFHASDGSLAPARVGAVVSHLDLFPTVVEALGGRVSAPDGLVEGRSLWPLLSGEQVAWPERAVFAQRKPLGERGAPDVVKTLYSLQSERFKLLDREDGPDEFYDLSADPRELDDRSGASVPELAEMERELERRVRLFETYAQGIDEQEIPADMLEQLRDLGYVR
jgi:arylsulfatase A-like enzyme